jgi:hypothetical protein
LVMVVMSTIYKCDMLCFFGSKLSTWHLW